MSWFGSSSSKAPIGAPVSLPTWDAMAATVDAASAVASMVNHVGTQPIVQPIAAAFSTDVALGGAVAAEVGADDDHLPAPASSVTEVGSAGGEAEAEADAPSRAQAAPHVSPPARTKAIATGEDDEDEDEDEE
ncbi:hypothetical protein EON66_06330 [archaeon]|nr:MAG: hypothetical protein EON66_06330 [archaeon]